MRNAAASASETSPAVYAAHERLDLVGRQRLPVALARHDDARIVDAHANPIRSAKLATVEPLDLDTQEMGDRVPQIAERVPCPDLVRAAGQSRREQRGPLPRVVGRRRRRIAAVVAGDEQDPAVERSDQVGQPPVERLDRLRVTGGVVAMPVLRVEVHEVREDERRRRPLEVVERQLDPVVVRVRVPALRDALTGEDVADLPDAVDGDAGRQEAVEHGRARGRHREVPTLGRPDERTGRPLERTGDHPADGVLAGEQASRDAAPLVQRRQRHHVLVRRDLEHGVAARVDDGLAGADVLVAELRDDLGARGRDVAQDPPPDRLLERLDDLGREPVRDTAGTARRAGSPSSPSARSSCPCRPTARWPGRDRSRRRRVERRPRSP